MQRNKKAFGFHCCSLGNEKSKETSTSIVGHCRTRKVGVAPWGQGILYSFFKKIARDRFRSLATAFFRNAMGFVVMFDVTNEQSFLNTRSWLQQLRTHAYTEDPVTILVGNKTDLDHIRKVQKSDAERFADKLGLKYMETSAQSGANVREAFEILLDGVLERMQRNVPAVGDPRVPDLVPDIEREDVRELKAENEAEEKRGLKRILPCCN